ncbi:ornithine cyclodeaminase family protein [Ktedonosporobacter rubrisoli]|uniref:Ornithine cyclodeaminase family protein n=1 Tax=Ktedonosporobacter rubrisoli TaxID=2509675 RepID=A0A4P6JII0_KTERU|nr:ornithine cyclodeaminase family protein [Ktedonosporobacter rubrisoli]QBD74868.1 ornithine cyclodeaminase family protein [Ktedonosporobacter rubrisoli]
MARYSCETKYDCESTMNDLRIISAAELRASVHFTDLIEPVSRAFQESSAGLANNGLIVMFPAASSAEGDVYVKTGTLKGHAIFIVKVSPWFAINRDLGRAQGGFIGVFDSQTGHTLALLNEEHYLSDIRTAAAGALAARAFAPAVVKTAGVLGTGVQAFWQAQALYHERPYETLIIWARSPESAARLKADLQPVLPRVEIVIAHDLESTVRMADVLITATSARTPLVRGEWLHAGQHITALGADDATKCELDVTALKRARVFVDARETTAAAGDIYAALQTGEYALTEVCGEVGEVLAGQKPGRVSPQDITITKFIGLGAQDLVAAEVSLKKLAAM